MHWCIHILPMEFNMGKHLPNEITKNFECTEKNC